MMRGHLLATATFAAIVLAVGAGQVAAARSPICTRGLTTVERDPRGLLPLTDMNPIGAAATAVLRYGQKTSRPQVRAAMFATADNERGTQARYSCGVRVWQRTVVVYVLDRAGLPAQSASQRVYFVGRFTSGYHIWQVVH
jgi:hypothetical protein